jgi:hypothetical protein
MSSQKYKAFDQCDFLILFLKSVFIIPTKAATYKHTCAILAPLPYSIFHVERFQVISSFKSCKGKSSSTQFLFRYRSIMVNKRREESVHVQLIGRDIA